MTDLTWEEKVTLAHQLSQVLTEERTDELLDLIEARLRRLMDPRMPGWMKAVTRLPLVPHPAAFVRNRLDGYMPEALLGPLLELIGVDPESAGITGGETVVS